MKNEVRPIDAEPLTLEQLRGMDGQPVMVEYLESEDGGINTGVILMNDPNESDNGVYVGCTFFCIKEYEKTWLAYAYPTAHIDREAWKCPLCERNKVISFEAWEDESKLPKGQSVRGGALFCPHCRKPRTPEAWAELEKRMGLA